MSFDQAAIEALYSQVSSALKSVAAFKSVIRHEPRSAPAALPAVALWFAGIGPARGASGLAATSPRVEYQARIYVDYTRPDDETEIQLQRLVSLAMGVFTGRFTLGGQAMTVDLLGAWGEPLSATAGYIDHDGHSYRVAQCVIPLIADDAWTQEA